LVLRCDAIELCINRRRSYNRAADRRRSFATLAFRAVIFRRRAMAQHRIFGTPFASVYPLYVQKVERKNRTKDDVDTIICWLTGYNQDELRRQIERESDFETFFAQAPAMNPNTALIKGVVCGVRVEAIEDPLMQKIRFLDKLIDELAKGKALDTILRQ
jgi:hypothetical protein